MRCRQLLVSKCGNLHTFSQKIAALIPKFLLVGLTDLDHVLDQWFSNFYCCGTLLMIKYFCGIL
jgi:hypothetical protein